MALVKTFGIKYIYTLYIFLFINNVNKRLGIAGTKAELCFNNILKYNALIVN